MARGRPAVKNKPEEEQEIIRLEESAPATDSVRDQGEDEIFALDIGTRTVVGILGRVDGDSFRVTEAVTVSHKRRAMMDGQIEDIGATAEIVSEVKKLLEEKSGIRLNRVAIAAAGRALVTKRSSVDNDVDGKDSITEEMVRSLELEAVSAAQTELDSDSLSSTSFYCVGHSVIKYLLDGYPIKNLVGHKGRKASVELIAAFLPSVVTESLYSVMDMVGLEVMSLTLEPIAAMNVIIPPEVRLINIALADIGAGTTDIAISQNGSIVAYAMATIAGDEITEEIIRKFLVDFETAERMKHTPPGQDVEFTDILGFEHVIESGEFYSTLFPAVEQLADTIAENIVSVNGSAPAAVFLVGGGSLIPELPSLVADKLGLPANRVAIGGQNLNKSYTEGKKEISGPEYVTPVGIGITATQKTGYDFSTITLNGRKLRIFDTKALSAAELLMNSGYKPHQIIGRSGRSLTFTLNGEKQYYRGDPAVPAEITINDISVPLETKIRKGDRIDFKPAAEGVNAVVKVSDIAGNFRQRRIFVDGADFSFGVTVRVNDTVVSGDYSIQNNDAVTVENIETLGDLLVSLPFDCSNIAFWKDGMELPIDYILCDSDYLTTGEPDMERRASAPNRARDIAEREERARSIYQPSFDAEMSPEDMTDQAPSSDGASDGVAAEGDQPQTQALVTEPMNVFLNGRSHTLAPNRDRSPHLFIELMAVADVDMDNPPPSGNMILTVNGKDASFMDVLNEGDDVIIRWDNQ